MKCVLYIVISFLLCILIIGCCDEKKVEEYHLEENQEVSSFLAAEDFESYELSRITYRNGYAYICVNGYLDEKNKIVLFKIDCANRIQKIDVNIPADTEVNLFDVGTDGTMFLITEQPDGTQQLISFRENSSIYSETDCDWNIENEFLCEICIGKSNDIYLFGESGSIYVLNDKGEWNYTITKDNEEIVLSSCRTSEGEVIFSTVNYMNDKEQLQLYKIDQDKQEASLLYKLDNKKFETGILSNGIGDDEFYLKGKQMICVGSIDSDTHTCLLRWKTGLFSDNTIESIGKISDKVWLVKAGNKILNIKYGKLSENKEEIKLVCVLADSSLQKQVTDFNKQSNNYYIEIEDYSDRENPYQSFMVNLTTSNDVDIVVLPKQNENFFLNKEILCDLYPFIDGDNEISREDFMPNIMEAYECNDRLYSTISRVHISSWVTKKTYLEDSMTWNQDTFLRLLDENSDAALFNIQSEEKILDEFLNTCLDTLIDWDNCQCEFRTKDFYDMLKIAKKYGEMRMEVQPEEEINKMKNGELLFSKTNITPYSIELYDDALNGDFLFVGVPFSTSGENVFWTSDLQYGIFKKSDCKDGAWSFVRTFLMEEYQSLNDNEILFGSADEGIPVRKDCFEDFIDRFSAKKSYKKNGRSIEPIDGYVGTNLFDYNVVPLTCEQTKIFRQIVVDTTKKRDTDMDINEIIMEEVKDYFSGRKKKEEVADVIQKRVTLYLNESKSKN